MDMRIVPRLGAARPVVVACAALAGFPAHAEYSSRLQMGNWSGGAWTDPATKEFRNCGLSVGYSAGTRFTFVVPGNLAPVMMYADQRIQAQPQSRFPVKAKFGDGAEMTLNGLAVSQGMVQITLPTIPHNYDVIRNAKQIALVLPGMTTTLNVEGFAKAMPQVIDCAVRERAKLQAPPQIDGDPGAREAALAGLAVAERSGVGDYIVFADDKRPGNMQQAASVAGFVGAAGPGGPVNILTTTYFIGPDKGRNNAEQKASLMQRIRSADPKATFGDLPGIPGKPNSFGIFAIGNNVYEEFYMVQRPAGGYHQFTTGTPLPGKATAEAAGVKFRAALSLVMP
jgi:hypothetical protein